MEKKFTRMYTLDPNMAKELAKKGDETAFDGYLEQLKKNAQEVFQLCHGRKSVFMIDDAVLEARK